MKLFLPYIISVCALFLKNKDFQILAAVFSILIYFLLSIHFPIGGDFRSLQARADSLEYGVLTLNLDIVFQILSQISKISNIEVSIIYSILIIALLPIQRNKPHLFLFGLVISYYFIVTGFQRQSLAGLLFVRSLNLNALYHRYVGFLLSTLTHVSAIFLISLSFINLKIRGAHVSILISFILFFVISIFGSIFDGTPIYHYIQYYFVDQMKSSGAPWRLVAVVSLYFFLVFRNYRARDRAAVLFEILTSFASILIITGFSTAGDRIIIFSITILLFSDIVTKATHLRLQVASIPFIGMNIFWVAMSKYAQVNW